MTQHEGLDPGKLTFSQAQGYEDLPGPLKLEEISDEARIRLWNLLVRIPKGPFSSNVRYVTDIDYKWRLIFQMLHEDFWLRPLDEFPGCYQYATAFTDRYKAAVLRNLPFNKVFDLFQKIMRHQECPPEFAFAVAEIFERCRLAYVVDTERPVTILPAATKQEGEAIIGAMKGFREAGLNGAETHLRTATELVNGGDWSGGSPREH